MPSPFELVGDVKVPSNPQLLNRPYSRLASGAQFNNPAMYAIVLEDEPVGPDSRLVFESFPGELEESYTIRPYRKMGGNRMPQPQFATYQGGDWGPFPLTLKFRAGIGGTANPPGDPNQVVSRDIESILIEMESKVNWLVALGFPLERTNVEAQRIVRNAVASGAVPASTVSQEQIAALKRNDPPFVLLVLGTWRVIRGYLEGPLVWRWTGPWHPVSGRPYGAIVSMRFQPLQSSYPTWQTIRNRAGQGGVAGPITNRFAAADQQRIVVTRNLLQNADARANPFGAPSEPGATPFGSGGVGANPFGG